jgi:uncharacterized protein YgiB involved in biofilm formation
MSAGSRSHRDASSKRSKVVTLTLMGLGAGAFMLYELWPSAPSEVPADAFQNVETCINSGRYSKATCERAFAEVAKHHEEMAPRYASAADCEADFTPGGCAPLPASAGTTGQSVYAPVLAGALIGGALGAGAAAALPATQPLYRSCRSDPRDDCTSGTRGGGLYTCAGYRVSSSYGSASVQRAAFSTTGASTATLSRGGFGARARAMSAAS